MKSYTLEFLMQNDHAILCCLPGDSKNGIWLSKSKIYIEGVDISEYWELKEHEKLDVYIPDRMAIDKGLL